MSQDGLRKQDSPFDNNNNVVPSTPSAKPPLLIAPRSATIARPIKNVPSNPFDSFEVPTKGTSRNATLTTAAAALKQQQQSVSTASTIPKPGSKTDLSRFQIPDIPIPANISARPPVLQPQPVQQRSTDPWSDFTTDSNSAPQLNTSGSRQQQQPVAVSTTDPWSSVSESSRQRSVSQPALNESAVSAGPPSALSVDDPWAAFSTPTNTSSAGNGDEETKTADKKGKKRSARKTRRISHTLEPRKTSQVRRTTG